MSATANKITGDGSRLDEIWMNWSQENSTRHDYPRVYEGMRAAAFLLLAQQREANRNPHPHGTTSRDLWAEGFAYAYDWLAEHNADALLTTDYPGA
jgi:hypothetical protein